MTESGAGQSKFVYLLNAMENAAQSDDPFIAGYRDKLAAVLKYVADLETGAAFEAGRGQWISVEERLPDASTTVLFYVVGEDWIETGFYRDDEKVWQAERTLPQDETLSFAAEGVTHWMDMPAPPDSGDKKEAERG